MFAEVSLRISAVLQLKFPTNIVLTIKSCPTNSALFFPQPRNCKFFILTSVIWIKVSLANGLHITRVSVSLECIMNVCTLEITNSDDKVWLPDNNTSVILTILVALKANCFKVRHDSSLGHGKFVEGVM